MAEQEPITAALLKTEHADVHTALLAEGVEAERARVKEIRGLTKHVKPELLNQAIDEGWTVDKAKSQFLAYFEEHAEARLQVLRDEHGDEGSGNDDEDPEQTSFDEGKAAGKNAPKKLAELKDGEDKWKLQWEHGDAELDMDTEKLHEEFSSFETYAAYKKNPDPADARRTG